jgi:hypothetical protein
MNAQGKDVGRYELADRRRSGGGGRRRVAFNRKLSVSHEKRKRWIQSLFVIPTGYLPVLIWIVFCTELTPFTAAAIEMALSGAFLPRGGPAASHHALVVRIDATAHQARHRSESAV